jgi:hypothetical protein
MIGTIFCFSLMILVMTGLIYFVSLTFCGNPDIVVETLIRILKEDRERCNGNH